MTRDYSAALERVFGPKPGAVNADVLSGPVPADALDVSGGIRAALDAEPGLMEQRARQAFTPAPQAASEPVEPAEYLLNPTSTWYTPPERKEPRGVSTDTLRLQMAEREVLRHAVLPEGPEDDGSGGLLRASFMLNSASRHKMDDVFSAASLSGALGMPLDMTLDSLDTAKELAAEFTPEKIKTFAPGFLRLVQHDYDAAMLWRHDIPTANAVSSAFDLLPSMSGGLGLAEEIRNRERPEADSLTAALDRGVHSAFTMLSQAALNLGRLGLEGLAATVNPSGEELPAYLPEGYKQFLKDGKAALLGASDSLGGLVREMSARQKEMALDSPLAGLRIWDEPEIMLDSRWWAENVPGVVASFLPIAGAYARGGEVAGGLAGLLLNGNEVYMDLLDKGLEDNAETRLFALLGGTAMSALDVLGLHGIFGGREAVRQGLRGAVESAARKGFAGVADYTGRQAGRGFLFEGSTEYAQNLVKAGVEAVAQDKDFGGVVADMADAAKQLEDFILGGLMGGVVSGVSGAASVREERDRQQFEALRESIAAAAQSEEVSEARAEVEAVAREAEDARSRMAFAQSLQEYIDATDASPLHASDPAVYERESERLIPENLRSVWLDADFVQEFVTEDGARLEALGLSAREVAEALQLQAGSVRVGTARLVSRFQGEERTLLLREARMAPGGMTLTEAQAFDPQARVEAAAERIRARSATDAEIGGERVRLKEEFVRAGYAPHLAEYYATLHVEEAKALAARYGFDAVALLRQRAVVRRKSGEMTDGALRQTLPQRFADLPPIEADSSLWFGEGKELPGIDGTESVDAAARKQLRDSVLQWAKKHFGEKPTVDNADTGWTVAITPKGIKDTLHHGFDGLLARSVPFIPQLVESGIHLDSIEKKPGLMSHIFANRIRLDGQEYVVGFVLREDDSGNRFYDHELTGIIAPDWLKPGPALQEGNVVHQTNRGDVMNILRDRLGVNDGTGRILFQTESSGARGMVRFDDGGASVTTIFADAADLSTPIHEGAHVFINDLIRVVADDGATARRRHEEELAALANDATLDAEKRQEREARLLVRRNRHLDGVRRARADLAALVDNANAQREAHGKAIGADLPPVTLEEVLQGTASPAQLRTLQEVNAAAFEGYVLEGKAPSSRLATVFHRMRQWLAALYRRAVVHGVKVTPEVRSVFDRMLATDEAIRRRDRTAAMLGDEGSFLDMAGERLASDMADDYERLQELYSRAEAEVTARMDRATLKDRNRRWREYYAEGRKVAAQDTLYAILDALAVKDGNPYSGISRDWLERQYGKTAVEDFLKTAAGRRIINHNGGQPLDAVGIGDILGNGDRAALMGLADADGLYTYLHDNIVVRRRTAAGDARALADRRLADDDALAEALLDDPSDAYSRYLEEVEATVIRLAARQGAEWRTPEQQARWMEKNRRPLAVLRRRVKDALRQRSLRDIRPDQFAGEVRKAVQERNAALAAGNALDALAAVDRARTALESWQEANRIRKEQEAFERLAQRLGAIKRDVVAPEAWTAIQDLLERFRLVAPRKRTGEDAPPLRRIISDLCGDADEISGLPAVADWLLDENRRHDWRDLTPERMRDLSDTLRMLEHLGRQVVAANRESEAARIDEAAEAGARAMKELAPVGVARDGTLRRRWQDWNRSFFGGMLSALQWQFRQADGARSSGPKRERGINEERLYGGILDGESRREVRMRGLVARLEPVFRRLADSARAWEKERGKTLTGRDGKPLPVPKVMLEGGKTNWTSDMVIAIALNLGNEGNVQRLREGYPDLTAETLAQLVGDDAARLVFADWRGSGNGGLLSAQDWRDVQEIGNILHTQWHDIQATHERLFGFKPRGVEARPMTIRAGGETVELAGWYYPAVYDPALSDDVRRREEQRDAVVRTEAVLAAPSARRGFTKSRAEGGGGAPLRLETGVIMSHLTDVTRFIELAEVVRFADRVTRSPQWRAAYIRAFGRQDYEAIRPNLKGVVLEERPPMDAVSRSADWLREKLVPWGLAFNFKTAILQATAVFPAMTDMGVANVLRGVGAVAKGRTALVRQIWEVSPYMESRMNNIDQDLRKAMRGIDARTRRKALRVLGREIAWEDVVNAGMLPLITVDMATSSAIWMAAYNAELARLTDSAAFRPGIDAQGEHHAAAVRAADMAVKAVNPDFMASSRSAFLRGRGVVRLLNMFSSAVALFAQRRAYNWTAARKAWAGAEDAGGKVNAAISYLRYEFFDFVLPGVAMGLILSLAQGEDEPEKIGGKIAGSVLDAASMRVPMFNAMITGLITGETWRGMSTVYQQPWEMAKRIRGSDGDKLAWAMADVISFMARVPVSKVARNAERGYDQWQRGDGTPFSIIMPRHGEVRATIRQVSGNYPATIRQVSGRDRAEPGKLGRVAAGEDVW